MNKLMSVLLCLAVTALPLAATDKEKIGDRLEDCGTVMKEILDMPDTISKDILNTAVCVMVIPAVKKGAFIVGASYGRGAITCRGGDDFNGSWSAPAMFRLIGGNVGFQIGGQETDYVLLVMNDGGVRALLRGKVKLGADASVAVGPVGRTADAQTNGTMRAEVLAYSRARGVFAGISLEGANLQEDQDANTTLYGHQWSAVDIVRHDKVKTPEEAQKLLGLLTKATPKHSAN